MSFKTFTEQEVIDTYNKFIKKEDNYFQKLSPLPLHLNNKNWKSFSLKRPFSTEFVGHLSKK